MFLAKPCSLKAKRVSENNINRQLLWDDICIQFELAVRFTYSTISINLLSTFPQYFPYFIFFKSKLYVKITKVFATCNTAQFCAWKTESYMGLYKIIGVHKLQCGYAHSLPFHSFSMFLFFNKNKSSIPQWHVSAECVFIDKQHALSLPLPCFPLVTSPTSQLFSALIRGKLEKTLNSYKVLWFPN